MRSGRTKSAPLARLGMVAMFATVALAAAPRRVRPLAELGELTGRRRPDLRRVVARLKASGVVREVSRDRYRLADDYAAAYETALERSGVAYAERAQRKRHEQDRAARAAKLGADRRSSPLRGRERNREVLAQREREERQREAERIRRKVGETPRTFLARELSGGPYRWRDLRELWRRRGGRVEDLQRAIRDRSGPYAFRREDADYGQLYVWRRSDLADGYTGPNARAWRAHREQLREDGEL
jgi:hypothetical protein